MPTGKVVLPPFRELQTYLAKLLKVKTDHAGHSCTSVTLQIELRRMLPMWRICLAGAPGVENVSNILTLKSKDYITCTDADNKNSVQIEDLASSLAQLRLGPC